MKKILKWGGILFLIFIVFLILASAKPKTQTEKTALTTEANRIKPTSTPSAAKSPKIIEQRKTTVSSTPSSTLITTAKVEKKQLSPTFTPAAKQTDYEIAYYENNKTVENYWLLIPTADKPRQYFEDLVINFKKDKCKKPCSVSLYDDNRAIGLDREYSKLTSTFASQQEIDSWKKQNYVFVANHLVGMMTFDADSFWGYPYMDWYYDSLK